MEITQKQYEKIEKYLPRQRGNVSMSNLQLINAILYVTENGCKWRALPEKYGNWHKEFLKHYNSKESSESRWKRYALTVLL